MNLDRLGMILEHMPGGVLLTLDRAMRVDEEMLRFGPDPPLHLNFHESNPNLWHPMALYYELGRRVVTILLS